MFSKKFWRDAAEAFVVAATAVLVVDAESLVAVGSREQALTVAVALGRAAVVAGLRAVAPRIIAYRDRP
jgi:hypothetical protein